MILLADLRYQTAVLGSYKHDCSARILGSRPEDHHGDENHAFDTVELLAHHQDQPGGIYQKICTTDLRPLAH